MDKKISIVVSVYNEAQSLENFYTATKTVLDGCTWDYELIFVNDGSYDSSLSLLKHFSDIDKKVKIIDFSRNFGHEAAMTAGIDYASGDGIICMDADLQHPPEYIAEIIAKFEEGYDVVSMIRTENRSAGLVKKITSAVFYKTLNIFSPVKFEENSSDFFGISRAVAEVLRHNYREKIRYLRGFVQSVGFNKTSIEFKANKREAGESKYSLKKLLSFSLNTLCSFSDFPLKLGIYSGCVVGCFGVLLMIYTIINKFVNGAPGGYTTIVVALCFLFAVLLFVIGVIGQYISILFQETKDRPIYIVKEVIEKNSTENTVGETKNK